MKKLMVMTMVLAMVSSLAACGTQNDTTVAKGSTQANVETVLNTTTTAATTASAASASGTTVLTTALTTTLSETAAVTTEAATTLAVTTLSTTKATAANTPKAAKTTAAKTTKKEEEETMAPSGMVGGWSVITDSTLDKNAAAKNAFEKAVGGMIGASYEPLAVLGTQIVSGNNYCILCRITPVVPDAQPTVSLVYIYEDLQGNAKMLGEKKVIDSGLLGGFTAVSGETAIEKNADAKKAFDTATKQLDGVEYEAEAVLGTQIVAGTNYLILCKATPVVLNPQTGWSLVTVNADLSGGASVGDIETIELGEWE
ncbi:MAG: hypothetical protein IK130_00205 [Oscillospiraceae bacterium]|nr:hypothetical protein [Oscillospiraceae bacterium]